MSKVLKVALLFFIGFSVGCATTPKTRFSEFYEVDSHTPNIDVLIDTVVLSDISGNDIGINKEKNSVAYSLANSSILSLLEVRGYSPNILYQGNGAFYEMVEDTNYFFSEDFKSTEVPYTGIDVLESDQVWVNDDIKTFISRLSEYAPLQNKKQRRKSSRKKKVEDEIKPISVDEIPNSVMQLPGDTMLVVRAYAGEVSAGKSIGTGLATGLLTAALTGGMYVYVAAPISGSSIEIIAFDKKASKIVWHNTTQAGNYKALDKSIEMAISLYPTTTGEIYKKPRKSRKSKKKSLEKNK